MRRNLFWAYDVWDAHEVHLNVSLPYIFQTRMWSAVTNDMWMFPSDHSAFVLNQALEQVTWSDLWFTASL